MQALVDRIPRLAPTDQFTLWTHPLAQRPLSTAPNTSEIVVPPGPNSPRTILWPQRFVDLSAIDLFHGPHNLLPRKLRCATVVTVHDVMALEAPELHLRGVERWLKRTYYPQAIWRALHGATRLIAPSKATADRIIALVPAAAKRLHVIWEATESCFGPPLHFAAAQKQAAEIVGGDWPYLLVLGANVPSKRHDLAVASFLAAVPPPWRLVLLQRRLAGSVPADRIIRLEVATREDVITLLQGAGALIQPSLYEGFGLPVLEAMACGCPVVASDIAAFREITEGSARLVPPNDFDALARAVSDIVDSDELRAAMRERGLAQAKKFSWERAAQETLEVYRAAAASA